MARTWFTAVARAGVGEIAIYGEIGAWGITAAAFREALAALGSVSTINLRINSPGGFVADGIAIHNQLARHSARIVVTVDGVAASIASLIAMAGDEILMPENASMLIHDPMGGAAGFADDLEKVASWLRSMTQSMAGTYAARTRLPLDEVLAIMRAETWFSAAEAKAKGFADKVLPPSAITARFDLSRYRSAPPRPAPGAVERAVASERNRNVAIAELCRLAGHSAQAFVGSGKTVDQVRAELLQLPRRGGSVVEISARHSGRAEEPGAFWDRVREQRGAGD